LPAKIRKVNWMKDHFAKTILQKYERGGGIGEEIGVFPVQY